METFYSIQLYCSTCYHHKGYYDDGNLARTLDELLLSTIGYIAIVGYDSKS